LRRTGSERALYNLPAPACIPPPHDVQTIPVQHAAMPANVFVNFLQVTDPVRLARDVRMNGDCHELWPRHAFLIQPIEAIYASFEPVLRFMVLH
jgi:hypothetical protein